MVRIAGIALALSLLATGSALAQAQPPTDPGKLELARKLVDASGGQKNAEKMLRQMYGSLDAVFAKVGTPEKRRLMQLVQRDLQNELITMIPAMMDVSVQAYARNLTDKELTDMLAFQTSDSGRAISAKLPAIMQDIMTGQVPMMQEMLPRLLLKTVDRACEEAKCSAAERQEMAEIMKQALRSEAS